MSDNVVPLAGKDSKSIARVLRQIADMAEQGMITDMIFVGVNDKNNQQVLSVAPYQAPTKLHSASMLMVRRLEEMMVIAAHEEIAE